MINGLIKADIIIALDRVRSRWEMIRRSPDDTAMYLYTALEPTAPEELCVSLNNLNSRINEAAV